METSWATGKSIMSSNEIRVGKITSTTIYQPVPDATDCDGIDAENKLENFWNWGLSPRMRSGKTATWVKQSLHYEKADYSPILHAENIDRQKLFLSSEISVGDAREMTLRSWYFILDKDGGKLKSHSGV
jgi:hypothetical protein